jgi:hypothetical protein
MPGGGKKIGDIVQEDRIRGGTAQRDRGGEPRTLPAYGISPLNVNFFIDGGWRTLLRIKNNRNIFLDPMNQAT